MNTSEIIVKIDEKIYRISKLKSQKRFSPEFKKWHRETRVLLKRVFGENTYQVRDFMKINFLYQGIHMVGDNQPFDAKFYDALDEAYAILTSIKEEFIEYGIESKSVFNPNPKSIIEEILRNFHSVAKQLRRRHDNRDTIDIEDEYDVQDLLHALLRIFFKDIRAEEWTPSYAGSSSRMDFLLKEERVVIETKMTRKSMKDKDLVDQLIVDVERYKIHPDCETLICFIYDPEGRIINRHSILSDCKANDLDFQIFIYPEE